MASVDNANLTKSYLRVVSAVDADLIIGYTRALVVNAKLTIGYPRALVVHTSMTISYFMPSFVEICHSQTRQLNETKHFTEPILAQ
jgi:hypothetical protein